MLVVVPCIMYVILLLLCIWITSSSIAYFFKIDEVLNIDAIIMFLVFSTVNTTLLLSICMYFLVSGLSIGVVAPVLACAVISTVFTVLTFDKARPVLKLVMRGCSSCSDDNDSNDEDGKE